MTHQQCILANVLIVGLLLCAAFLFGTLPHHPGRGPMKRALIFLVAVTALFVFELSGPYLLARIFSKPCNTYAWDSMPHNGALTSAYLLHDGDWGAVVSASCQAGVQ